MKTIGARLHGFFKAIGKSCYDMEFYRAVRQRPLGAAFTYIIGLLLVLTALLFVTLLPAAFKAKGALLTYMQEKVPAGSQIAFEKGRLSTNLPQPFEFEDKDSFNVIVDTSYEGMTFPDERIDGEGIFVGRDALFARQTSQLRTYPFKDVPDDVFTVEEATDVVKKFATPAIIIGLFLICVLTWAGMFIGTTFTVLIYAFFAWGLGHAFKARLPYGRWYAVGLHAVTLPMIVDAGFKAFGKTVPYVYTAIFFLIIAAVIQDERAQPTIANPERHDAPPAPKPPAPAPPEDKLPPTTE